MSGRWLLGWLMVVLAGCTRPLPPGEGRAEQWLQTLQGRARLGQLVLVEAGSETGAATLEPVGGMVWRGRPPEGAAPREEAANGVPSLVAVVVEPGGGAGSGTVVGPPALRRLFGVAAPEEMREIGRALARDARGAGIHLGLVRGPPTNLDEPLPPHLRAPERSAAALAALVEGAAEGGLILAPELFHVEGADTVVTLDWDRARLEAFELRWLEAAEGANALVLGSVAVPALTGDSVPLPLSAAAVRGLIRRDLAWEGVVVADLSAGGALVRRHGPGEAAVRALMAGADLLAGVRDPAPVLDALERATASGRLPAARTDEALRRVLALKERALTAASRGTPETTPAAAPHELAARLAGRIAATPSTPVLREVSAAEAGISEAALRRADGAVREALGDSVLSAAALAVGRRGGLVLLRGYGTLDAGREVDAAETLFDIASLSKVVGTTSAAAVLVEDGRLGLDAPVQRYLPEFRGERKGAVTVRHLLTHTSGLPAGIWLFGAGRTREEALRLVLRQPLVSRPGERVVYSDLGMILLAEVVERAAGERMDHLLARRVFAPLGMSSTMYLPPIQRIDATVPTAEETERPFPLRAVVHDANAFRLGGVAGHAGLFSTARDLAVFAQAMLNGGSYGPAAILTPTTVRAFTARQPRAGTRGLGWDTPAERSTAGRFFSSRSFGHTGYTGTSLWIDPERELFVVLLTNRTYTRAGAGDILRLRQAVHDAVAQGVTDERVTARPRAR